MSLDRSAAGRTAGSDLDPGRSHQPIGGTQNPGIQCQTWKDDRQQQNNNDVAFESGGQPYVDAGSGAAINQSYDWTTQIVDDQFFQFALSNHRHLSFQSILSNEPMQQPDTYGITSDSLAQPYINAGFGTAENELDYSTQELARSAIVGTDLQDTSSPHPPQYFNQGGSDASLLSADFRPCAPSSSPPLGLKRANFLDQGMGSSKRQRLENRDNRYPGDCGENGRNTGNYTGGKPPVPEFACYLSKVDNQKWGACDMIKMTENSYVKQHLKRHHYPGHKNDWYCPKCREVWLKKEKDSEALWKAHHNNPQGCIKRTFQETGILIPEEFEKLKACPARLSEPEKWQWFWEVLLPGLAPPVSPFVENLGVFLDRKLPEALESVLRKFLSRCFNDALISQLLSNDNLQLLAGDIRAAILSKPSTATQSAGQTPSISPGTAVKDLDPVLPTALGNGSLENLSLMENTAVDIAYGLDFSFSI